MAQAQEVAQWMMDELNKAKILEQHVAAAEIERKFGKEHVYTNDGGNTAISKKVLAAFRKISGNVVWDKIYKEWRFRETGDDAGRAQD